MTPKGIRLNNPGNIRKGAEPWIGQIIPGVDPDFCQFAKPEQGIRALGRILQTYQNKHKIRTLRAAIIRWAPGNENDTDAYIADVCERSGFGPDAIISFNDLTTLAAVVKAIIWHENGQQPYADDLIMKSL